MFNRSWVVFAVAALFVAGCPKSSTNSTSDGGPASADGGDNAGNAGTSGGHAGSGSGTGSAGTGTGTGSAGTGSDAAGSGGDAAGTGGGSAGSSGGSAGTGGGTSSSWFCTQVNDACSCVPATPSIAADMCTKKPNPACCFTITSQGTLAGCQCYPASSNECSLIGMNGYVKVATCPPN